MKLRVKVGAVKAINDNDMKKGLKLQIWVFAVILQTKKGKQGRSFLTQQNCHKNRTLLITFFFCAIGQDSNPNNASKARKTKQRKYITSKYVPHLQTYETEADLVLTEPTGLYIVRLQRMQK